MPLAGLVQGGKRLLLCRPGSARTVNAGSASRAAVAAHSPGTTRWIAPIRGGKAVESTRSASPASQGPGPAPAFCLRA